MFLILASAAPLAAMAVLLLLCRIGSRSEAPRLHRAHRGPYRLAMERRWEWLSMEVARLEHRRASIRSGAVMRRRHLAAVLPADARR